eukprot:GHVS01026342.1.p1 GENE.GHVS01026342.1~~GHVS01026342.1.p1  ORF type:complete len:199 (+),score=30.47 GHVS01026342.1:89-685(+)
MDKQGRIVVVVGESPLLRVSVVSANTQPSGPTDNRFVEYVINVSIPKFTAIGDTTTATTTTATGTSTGTSTDTAAYCTKATRGGRSNGFSWSEQEGGEAFDESWRRWHEEKEEERFDTFPQGRWCKDIAGHAAEWVVRRRFSDFVSLYAYLECRYASLPTLPPKTLLRNFAPEHLKKRSEELNTFVKAVATRYSNSYI